MSIKIELGATYEGMDCVEAAKLAMQLRDEGFDDDFLNELLERSKDKEQEHE